jgi:hypothetical protein
LRGRKHLFGRAKAVLDRTVHVALPLCAVYAPAKNTRFHGSASNRRSESTNDESNQRVTAARSWIILPGDAVRSDQMSALRFEDEFQAIILLFKNISDPLGVLFTAVSAGLAWRQSPPAIAYE